MKIDLITNTGYLFCNPQYPEFNSKTNLPGIGDKIIIQNIKNEKVHHLTVDYILWDLINMIIKIVVVEK